MRFYLRVLGSPNPDNPSGEGCPVGKRRKCHGTRTEVGRRRISPYIRLIHFRVPHFSGQRSDSIRELHFLMFVGFFAFSNLRKVRGFRSSLGGPNYATYRGEATFCSSRRYGRFSLHSGRCDACAIRLNITFFHVFWFPTNGIPIRQGAFF